MLDDVGCGALPEQVGQPPTPDGIDHPHMLFSFREMWGRGWTFALIRDYLTDPDCLKIYPPHRLYHVRRVLAAERKMNEQGSAWIVPIHPTPPPPTFLNLTGLPNRGWTKGLIKIHLGKPDFLGDHPRSPTQFYHQARVVEAEQHPPVCSRIVMATLKRQY